MAPVDADSFRPEKPHAWSGARISPRPRGIGGPSGRSFALHPDGERLAMSVLPTSVGDARQDKVVVIVNFIDELRV